MELSDEREIWHALITRNDFCLSPIPVLWHISFIERGPLAAYVYVANQKCLAWRPLCNKSVIPLPTKRVSILGVMEILAPSEMWSGDPWGLCPCQRPSLFVVKTSLAAYLHCTVSIGERIFQGGLGKSSKLTSCN